MNETHNRDLRSWVESANEPGADFPIQNLPFGVCRRKGSSDAPRIGVAIGDQILDVGRCALVGLFDKLEKTTRDACMTSSLNSLMALGRDSWTAVRKQISFLLHIDSGYDTVVEPFLIPMHDAELLLPAIIGDYTDFYASLHHAINVGGMFRPDSPLLPNYRYVPIAYHGRSSSIIVSGTGIRRPTGQMLNDETKSPVFAASKMLDYELEVGLFVGPGNTLGDAIPISEAEQHMFGICLVNDWSARDIQKWEYQPLGPFLGKNFATTISPWVVTMEALEPYRVAVISRPSTDPPLMPYLSAAGDRQYGGIDLTLEVFLRTEQMRQRGMPPVRLSQGNFRDMYWTLAQMLTHHTSNGCNMRPGDLLASGTVTGKIRETRGCLLELTWRGAEPVRLPSGEALRFLQDGDEVIMHGYCERPNAVRIGFGECRGVVLPAKT
jgi:fumarylacetoacetase